jgi:hypothetical protein
VIQYTGAQEMVGAGGEMVLTSESGVGPVAGAVVMGVGATQMAIGSGAVRYGVACIWAGARGRKAKINFVPGKWGPAKALLKGLR